MSTTFFSSHLSSLLIPRTSSPEHLLHLFLFNYALIMHLWTGKSWQARASRADSRSNIAHTSRHSIGRNQSDISNDELCEILAKSLRLQKSSWNRVCAESSETVVCRAGSWGAVGVPEIEHSLSLERGELFVARTFWVLADEKVARI